MAAAHLLAASTSSSSTAAFRPPLRLRSPTHTPHLRLNRTGRRPFPVVRAAETDAKDVKPKAPEKAPAAGGSSFNQLLGIKGAKQETDIWKIRLQLTKPVTWPPLVWGVLCGAAASGNFHWTVEDVAKSIVCMIMSGPCLTGYTQTINDWYDRDIDAINEPYRPIPSGAISENEVITQIWVLLLAGLGLGALLDVWAGHDFPIVFYLAVGGSLLSYIYSAPPLKLKQNGWIGNFALGASYISLPWWAGQALFGTLTPDIVVLTTLYSVAGLGIAIVNDFKSIEGDRALGLQSLPVAFGMETAKWICVGAIDITQLSVAGYLLNTGKLYYALALLGLTIPQVVFQEEADMWAGFGRNTRGRLTCGPDSVKVSFGKESLSSRNIRQRHLRSGVRHRLGKGMNLWKAFRARDDVDQRERPVGLRHFCIYFRR